ncbi:uncharacterized protein LOC9634083 [Selaginella moellendorffii]|uniref:uncharacterized protein LOC9634083 n=1 Tax=Selaginella moellendorffii TaxID=88036 RepID=UPI000D1C5259|nr:uncharacterized protein LOC9634083 [Selaginella moellendorffii]|eukprot:XP_002966374.2 uncharacterized protein LOC9634083 [Selaginella moellendorffii]
MQIAALQCCGRLQFASAARWSMLQENCPRRKIPAAFLVNSRLFSTLRQHDLRGLIVSRSQRSYDDEFRSTASIALGLHQRYKKVVQGGFSNNLQDFITAVVTAYAIGCTEEGLRKELLNSNITSKEVEECILWVIIVFTSIMSSPPPTVIRWSTTAAVTAESLLEWKGFCSIIANAYYNRGMAWLPVKTLQLEQMAVLGRAEEASLVADRMRLAFTTLEIVCPQWPKK